MEVDKTRGLVSQLEQEAQKRCLLQNDQSALSAELVGLRSRERQLQRELEAARDLARTLEEELHKLRTTKSIDDMQMRELQDQLEAEQYFSTLYKTQVTKNPKKSLKNPKESLKNCKKFPFKMAIVTHLKNPKESQRIPQKFHKKYPLEMAIVIHHLKVTELREEADEKTKQVVELEEERSGIAHQLQLSLARADSEALARAIAEETVAELEKEKTMKELEIKGQSHPSISKQFIIDINWLKNEQTLKK